MKSKSKLRCQINRLSTVTNFLIHHALRFIGQRASSFKMDPGYPVWMSFEPVNDLERLLIRAVTEPAARPDFYRALLESPLYFVRIGTNPMGM